MTVDIDVAPIQATVTNFSKTLSRRPVTKTTSNYSGDETLTEGTSAYIQGALFVKEDEWAQDKAGLFLDTDAILLVLPAVVINKDDIIIYDCNKYRVQKSKMRKIAEAECYRVAQLFFIGETAYSQFITVDGENFITSDSDNFTVLN